MVAIPKSIVKRVPYVGPVVSAVELALDVKDIVETATPVGAAKIVVGCLVNECTPSELLIGGKCVILAGGNPLVISGTVSTARSIVRG